MSFNPKEHLVKIKKWDQSSNTFINVEYLEAKWRLYWFREEHPDWTIDIELNLYPANSIPSASLAKAVILDEDNRPKAVDYGYCEKIQGKDKNGQDIIHMKFVEKSITTAIARALAQLGYGTQWAIEFEEDTSNEEQLSDSGTVQEEQIQNIKDKPTAKQLEYLQFLATSHEMTEESLKNFLLQNFKVESPEQLSKEQMKECIRMLKGEK